MHCITTRIAIAIAMTALVLAAFASGHDLPEVVGSVAPFDHVSMHEVGTRAQPARMQFSMSVPTQGGQAGEGPVRGDMIGYLYSRLTAIDRDTPHWLVAYDWTFAAGPDTFTATLAGTYDSEDRVLILAGIVDEGRLRGARIDVSATHSEIAGGHYRGTFQIHQD